MQLAPVRKKRRLMRGAAEGGRKTSGSNPHGPEKKRRSRQKKGAGRVFHTPWGAVRRFSPAGATGTLRGWVPDSQVSRKVNGACFATETLIATRAGRVS